MTMKTVMLVDGDNLANRNYYAQNLSTEDGFATGLIYGVIQSMLSQQLSKNYDLVVLVWDPPGGSQFRKGIFPIYKANRSQKEGNFLEQKELCQDLLDAMGVAQVIKPGVECDDVIGYLANVTYADCLVDILSNDEDMLQLITERVSVINPNKGKVLLQNGKLPIEKQGKVLWIRPDQVVSYKALAGDTSDNYPGIPQFGIVAAIKFFEVNDNVHQLIDGKAVVANQTSTVIRNASMTMCLLPKFVQLATINMQEGEVPEPLRPPVDQAKTRALFQELEFEQFLQMGSRVYCIGGKL